jgi:hypothetical protein
MFFLLATPPSEARNGSFIMEKQIVVA